MTGIELIVKEREEQLNKHGRTVEEDVKFNSNEQLREAALMLILDKNCFVAEDKFYVPNGWDEQITTKMLNKPIKDRLVIAAALLAAEIDRLNYIEQND